MFISKIKKGSANMKKCIPSYLSGVLTTVLILILTTTALAASGKVTFNFANVSLHGEQKIAAGTEITVANGQKVPSSILYTDPAGGKTNYLPIRAISELLGVEIGYDSATRTVQIMTQSPDEGTQSVGTLGPWQRTLEGNTARYVLSGRSETKYDQAPAWRPTWLPDGWTLNSIGVESSSNALTTAIYQKDTDDVSSDLQFQCFAPMNRTCAHSMGQDVKAADLLEEATVKGQPADFYQAQDFNLLVWSDAEGNLFKLMGDFDLPVMEKIANSVAKVSTEKMPEYQMQWTPDGSTRTSRTYIPGVVRETWMDENNVSFSLLYARESLAVPARSSESVLVGSAKAEFWTGLSEGGIDRGDGSPHIYTQEQKNVLLWTDPNSKVTFRLVGMMEKDDMIKMAESMVLM